MHTLAAVISVVLSFLFQRILCSLNALKKRNLKQDFDLPLSLALSIVKLPSTRISRKSNCCYFYINLFQNPLLTVKAAENLPVVRPNVPLPSRTVHTNSLKYTSEFDVLVIGGGATGCGVALDAVTRGKTLCNSGKYP